MNEKDENKPYLIDDEPANMSDIIKKAKEYGYKGDGGFYYTSSAANVLRKHGHFVGDNRADELLRQEKENG